MSGGYKKHKIRWRDFVLTVLVLLLIILAAALPVFLANITLLTIYLAVPIGLLILFTALYFAFRSSSYSPKEEPAKEFGSLLHSNHAQHKGDVLEEAKVLGEVIKALKLRPGDAALAETKALLNANGVKTTPSPSVPKSIGSSPALSDLRSPEQRLLDKSQASAGESPASSDLLSPKRKILTPGNYLTPSSLFDDSLYPSPDAAATYKKAQTWISPLLLNLNCEFQ